MRDNSRFAQAMERWLKGVRQTGRAQDSEGEEVDPEVLKMTRKEVQLCVAIDFLCDDCFEEFEQRCADSFGLKVYHGHIGRALMVDLMGDERDMVYQQVLKRIDECCWHKY